MLKVYGGKEGGGGKGRREKYTDTRDSSHPRGAGTPVSVSNVIHRRRIFASSFRYLRNINLGRWRTHVHASNLYDGGGDGGGGDHDDNDDEEEEETRNEHCAHAITA